MNIDIIEGLNDDQIMSLYEDMNVGNIHVAGCACWSLTCSTCIRTFGNQNYGGCALLRDRIPNEAACDTWCTTPTLAIPAPNSGVKRFKYNYFRTSCWCEETRSNITAENGGFYACR